MAKLSFSPLILILIMILARCNTDHSGSRPNVLIVFIDDMGYADPSCFGNRLVKTPAIDKLATEGLRITNFYVNAPICSPSRVALNTGHYPMRYAIHSYLASSEKNRERGMANYLDPSANTIAKTLHQNGYVTGHFGKWHMGGGRDLEDVPHPAEYGYDRSLVSFEGIGDRVLFPGDDLCKQSAALGKGKIIWAEKYQSTGIYVDSALAFIERAGDKPFFVNFCPNDVHDPHLPSPEILEKFKTIIENPFEQKFLAVLAELDKQTGRLLSEMDRMGKLENTIIVFTSDNGPTDWPSYYRRTNYPENYQGDLYPPGSAGEYFGRKWSLYEGGIRMPFIIRWKGHIPEGTTDSETILSAIDLFPSLCKLLDIAYPDDLDGKDKSQAFLGTPLREIQPIFWEYGSCQGGSILPGNPDFISPELAIREGEWKLLINFDSTNVQLYNLKNDPGETMNLMEAETERTREMIAKVLNWRRTLPVSFPPQN
jgi:arylsulfatase A-like enzyme